MVGGAKVPASSATKPASVAKANPVTNSPKTSSSLVTKLPRLNTLTNIREWFRVNVPEIGLVQDSMGGYHFAVKKGDGDASNEVSGVRHRERKISTEVNRKLRSSSPTKKIQDDVNKNIDDLIGTPDPALPGKTIDGKLHADHIVPFAKISRMDGFETLTYEQQKAIVNYRENFIGLTETANKSKGSKSYEEWTIYKKEGILVNPEFRVEMILKERDLESEIQNIIDEFNKLNRE